MHVKSEATYFFSYSYPEYAVSILEGHVEPLSGKACSVEHEATLGKDCSLDRFLADFDSCLPGIGRNRDAHGSVAIDAHPVVRSISLHRSESQADRGVREDIFSAVDSHSVALASVECCESSLCVGTTYSY